MRQQEGPKNVRLNLLDDIQIEQWKSICPSLEILDIPDKAMIYQQGDRCEHVFWVVDGHIRLSHLTEKGDELVIDFLTKGELFGLFPPDNAMREADETATAKGAAQLYRLKRSDLKALLSRNPDLAWQIIAMIAARQRASERKLESVLFETVEQRLIRTLYDLAERFGESCSHGYALDIFFTQQEIADLVGASRPVISTILNDFKKRKLLNFIETAVCVMQKEMFARLLAA